MSLCVSLLLLLTVFIAGAERRGGVIGCRCVAVLLHYFLLTSVAWMSLEAYSLYVSLVKVAVSHSSSLFVVSSFVAWGVPALIVAITAGVASDNYGNNRTWVIMFIKPPVDLSTTLWLPWDIEGSERSKPKWVTRIERIESLWAVKKASKPPS